jgi:Spy/CpxP family protein refolding chaperone
MKRLAHFMVAAAIAWTSVTSNAQDAGSAASRDPIAEHVMPPELIMQNQRALGLTDAQKSAVIAEVKRAQGRMVDLQWDLQRAMERLVELLRPDKPDEAAVIAQLDTVLAAEREIKHIHLALAVRLKGILTPAQQKTLRELRSGSAGPK